MSQVPANMNRARPPLPALNVALATPICLLVVLSGAAALVFETLWFYQATLVFGNTVWASLIVLASFMGGLALGNGLAARFHLRFGNPIRLYAVLELVVGLTGLGLVFVLPLLPSLFAPVFDHLRSLPLVSNLVRGSGAFMLMGAAERGDGNDIASANEGTA